MTAKCTILLVDDDDGVRRMVTTLLSLEGYAVVTATDRREALDLAEHVHPDLILLDIYMPVMDGGEFVREYRARHREHAPIIAFTALTDPVERGVEIGAEGTLAKPFELDDLLKMVRLHLRE